jgi:hypothetical protein
MSERSGAPERQAVAITGVIRKATANPLELAEACAR